MPQRVEPEVADPRLLAQSPHELLPILKRPHLGFACLAAGVRVPENPGAIHEVKSVGVSFSMEY